MPGVVLVMGVGITGVSLFLLVQPGKMAGLLDKVFAMPWLYATALLRLLLGAALIASAPTVAYPSAVALCGWLFALAALLMVVIPAPAVRGMAGWFGQLSATMTRLWLSCAVLLGLFFVYAALS